MTLRIQVNEAPLEIADGTTVQETARRCKPEADVFILNGFPVVGITLLKDSDHLILIKRGEIPKPDQLELLMSARHTPGIHARLKQAVIGIAGCGGLGSNVAVSLARVGVGKLIIADFDIVEPSNLNRQQYFTDQIGQSKVMALQANLERINPGITIISHQVLLTLENIPGVFGEAEILIEAFDRPDQKAMLVETVEKHFPKMPLILGLGMAGYGFNHLLHTRSVGNLHVCGDELAEAAPGRGLMAPRVGIVANLQANLALELLLGKDLRLQEILDSRA